MRPTQQHTVEPMYPPYLDQGNDNRLLPDQTHCRNRLLSLVMAVLTVFLLTSCASVSVDPRYSIKTPIPKPELVFVDQFRLDADAAPKGELTEKRRRLPAQLQAKIVARLKAQNIAAEASSEDDKRFLHDAWYVTGSFTKMRAGNRVMRALIGFGAGRTQLAVNVVVDSSEGARTQRVLEFDASGGSGARPGALLPANNPIAPVMHAIAGAGPGLSADTDRAGRMIAAYIAKELAARGFITPTRLDSVKIRRNRAALAGPAT